MAPALATILRIHRVQLLVNWTGSLSPRDLSSRWVRRTLTQNRATRFYLAGRQLYQAEHFAPAAYCATISIELLLKATLIYWDATFRPEDASHGLAKLARILGNKVKSARGFKIPEYFYFEQRFLTVTRYPKSDNGVFIPASLLEDLDSIFAYVVPLVPFQHNTELKRALAGRNRRHLNTLRRGNLSIRNLRKSLGVRAR